MAATEAQSDWVERVLGVRPRAAPAPPLSRDALGAAVSSLAAKAGTVADAPRPGAPPRQQATGKLLATMAARPAPEDAAGVPDHVAAFLPDFLVSVEAERPAASQRLEAGSPVPGPDQLLGIADLFAAAQRSMIEWEGLLDQAEAADSTLDLIEEQAEEQDERRDEAEYADTLLTYSTRREQTIAAEARALKLMSDLQVAFNSLSESAQAAALKEAGGGA